MISVPFKPRRPAWASVGATRPLRRRASSATSSISARTACRAERTIQPPEDLLRPHDRVGPPEDAAAGTAAGSRCRGSGPCRRPGLADDLLFEERRRPPGAIGSEQFSNSSWSLPSCRLARKPVGPEHRLDGRVVRGLPLAATSSKPAALLFLPSRPALDGLRSRTRLNHPCAVGIRLREHVPGIERDRRGQRHPATRSAPSASPRLDDSASSICVHQLFLLERGRAPRSCRGRGRS